MRLIHDIVTTIYLAQLSTSNHAGFPTTRHNDIINVNLYIHVCVCVPYGVFYENDAKKISHVRIYDLLCRYVAGLENYSIFNGLRYDIIGFLLCRNVS